MTQEIDSPFTAIVGGLAHGGEFVCTVEAEGDRNATRGWWTKKAFVRGVVPGERISALVKEEERSFLRATLLKVIAPSADRCPPPCPIFGECGGCDLQHMNLAAQRKAKREMVESMLARQAGVHPINGVHLVGEQLPGYGYRSRIDLHLDSAGQLGFYRSGSGDVVPVERCLLAVDPINVALKNYSAGIAACVTLIEGVRIGMNAQDQVEVILKLREHCDETALNDQALSVLIRSIPNLSITLKEDPVYEQLEFSPVAQNANGAHFSQVNSAGNRKLQELVVAAVAAAPQVTELYAGAGNFTFILAAAGSRIDAVEADPVLARMGATYANEHSLPITYFAESCERFVERNRLHPVVLLDPTRSGARAVIPALCAPHIERIIYVSCSVPTLARDLKELSTAGFKALRTDVIDMFAQTHHVETVTVMGR